MSELIVQQNQNGLKEIIDKINSLPTDEKAQLLSSLLGDKDAGMSVIFGNGGSHVLSADVVVQINSSDPSFVQTIAGAIASRIEKRS